MSVDKEHKKSIDTIRTTITPIHTLIVDMMEYSGMDGDGKIYDSSDEETVSDDDGDSYTSSESCVVLVESDDDLDSQMKHSTGTNSPI